MNIGRKIYCRIFQRALWISLPFLPYRNPGIYNSLGQIPDILKEEKKKKPLVVTDENLSRLGAVKPLLEILEAAGVEYALFDKAFPNPTTQLAREGAAFYRKQKCDSLIAFGGGSPMDLAKGIGVGIVRPRTPLEKMGGILKVWRKLPLLIAVPTTAGTGSETTLAAVLIEEKSRHKFAINDFPLIPRYAVLDPVTIHTLPASVAATTGLDALTHAVEAYIGRSTTKETRADARRAVRLIFANLEGAVYHTSTQAEAAMLEASHYAGRAFTRSYVGYIHAVSHSLSGEYDLPHGWTNAVLLPLVLRRYGKAVRKPLAELALCAGLGAEGESRKVLAEKFISAIEEMNKAYHIPDKIQAIRREDISRLAAYADKEANPLYPVPVLWDARQLEEIYKEVAE